MLADRPSAPAAAVPLEGRHCTGNVSEALAVEGRVQQWALRRAVKPDELILISPHESSGIGDVGQLHVGPPARALAREQGGIFRTCPGARAEVSGVPDIGL